jgi:hypothetical protein
MARARLGGGSTQKKETSKPNPYCGGLWVKEDGDDQRLTYIAKSDDDKAKLLDYLKECIDNGESFALFGIPNSYKKGDKKKPDYVFMIPSKKKDD